MAWAYLLIASFVEIGWAIGLKFTAGFTQLVPSVAVGVGIILSFYLVARAAKEIPIGTAYGIFVGIGAGGTGAVAVLAFGEPANLARMLSLAAIVVGVVGLKLFGAAAEKLALEAADHSGRALR
ncbi:DMT family transporter [Mesorhizobium sp. L-8-3]|uniref:DMT family transporter n=1 Tax=Mesorhizobium sp. L-8-3 TaxID=2744522 RepID=UPI0019293E94|nr:multidrug efflux SMR transporter [Mesorhizobium sp. L-8-3]BCH24558.1 multidrug transporter [Mesorhizobium sp. L-8-3]